MHIFILEIFNKNVLNINRYFISLILNEIYPKVLPNDFIISVYDKHLNMINCIYSLYETYIRCKRTYLPS